MFSIRRVPAQTALVILVGLLPFTSQAQKKPVTVRYLRAAITSVKDRTSLTVRGEYVAVDGLRNVTGRYMRDKPFSRFTVLDPVSGLTFTSMYCEHNSPVFAELIDTTGRKVFDFDGEKTPGEDGEEAILVKRVQLVGDRNANAEPPEATSEGPLRVTLTDSESGTRTVLVNVVKGTPYKVGKLTVVVEDE